MHWIWDKAYNFQQLNALAAAQADMKSSCCFYMRNTGKKKKNFRKPPNPTK